MGLNKEQALAVSHRDGPMMVLAGPGSGKTHTLVQRIIHLIEHEGIPPSQILVITFSKKAAKEMQDRFRTNTEGNIYPVTFGTFHAIFYHILKHNYNYSKDSILTTKQKIEYISEITHRQMPDCDDVENKAIHFLEKISKYKSLCGNKTERLEKLSLLEEEQETFVCIYDAFEKKMRNEGKIDFDDMIYLCNKLLRENEHVRNKWQSIYKYFLVDEFQDINETQYSTLELLAGKDNNIFAVGDDDQSIYGFRGARPQIMQEFVNNMPDCKVVNLRKNYRCSEHIIATAAKVISHNSNRIEKYQLAEKKDKDKGIIDTVTFATALDEAEFVVNVINSSAEENGYIKSTAVLYRTARDANLIEEKLVKHGIPCVRNKENDFFYDNEFIKDIMIYIKLAVNADKSMRRRDIYAVLNKPDRGLSREGIVDDNISENIEKYYMSSENSRINWHKLISDIKKLKDMCPFLAVNYILKGIGYEKYMKKGMLSRGQSFEKYNSLKEELLIRSKEFKSLSDWLLFVDAMRENAGNSAVEENENKLKGKVVMQTIHASKGLEYDTVFIIGLMEGSFPHNKAVTEEDIEEERRLLYVAITRARYNLYIIGHGDNEYGKRVSRFIGEINGQTV